MEGLIRRGLRAGGRGVVVGLVSSVGGLALLVATALCLVSLPLGVGVLLLPPTLGAVRTLAEDQRRCCRDWFGVPIPSPYRPMPDEAGMWRRCRRLLADPATWRDLLWLVWSPVGLALAALPAGLIGHALVGIVLAVVAPRVPFDVGWVLSGPGWLISGLTVLLDIGLVLAGLAIAEPVLRLWARCAKALLAPTAKAALAARVGQLSRTRSQAVDAQAAELRRIERDLHDGAQARLVSLGMSLGMAEDLFASDPDTALRLLAEARQAGDEALAELRDLVRGIHPPVLAERGLDGALRALALTLPLPVEVDIDLPARPAAPVETAVYFAIAEALANVVKHSRAGRAWVRLEVGPAGLLRAGVGDNGVGGADPVAGSGLSGIRHRLAAHDGTLAVASPPGGPTVLTMEVPCAL